MPARPRAALIAERGLGPIPAGQRREHRGPDLHALVPLGARQNTTDGNSEPIQGRNHSGLRAPGAKPTKWFNRASGDDLRRRRPRTPSDPGNRAPVPRTGRRTSSPRESHPVLGWTPRSIAPARSALAPAGQALVNPRSEEGGSPEFVRATAAPMSPAARFARLTLPLADLRLKTGSRSDTDDLPADFPLPCLRRTMRHRRAVGLLTSRGPSVAAQGVTALLGQGGRMLLVASPLLDPDDLTFPRSLASVDASCLEECPGERQDPVLRSPGRCRASPPRYTSVISPDRWKGSGKTGAASRPRWRSRTCA